MKVSDRTLAQSLLIGASLFVVACVPAPEPTPSPSPIQTAPTPAPAPTPMPTSKPMAASEPEYENWIDAPRTPGNWNYNDLGFATQALYSNDEGELFVIQCLIEDPESASRRIVLARPGKYDSDVPIRVLTETATRSFSAKSFAYGEIEGASVFLPAGDPLFDAMALTRGRFAVETPENPTLYLPAWAEVTRVIEDCR